MDESGPPNFASNSSSEKIEEEKKQEGIIEPNKTPQEAGLMDWKKWDTIKWKEFMIVLFGKLL